MEALIKQAFEHVDQFSQHVADGHYDLSGPDGEIILPQMWEAVVKPGWNVTMIMWPVPAAPTLANPEHQPASVVNKEPELRFTTVVKPAKPNSGGKKSKTAKEKWISFSMVEILRSKVRQKKKTDLVKGNLNPVSDIEASVFMSGALSEAPPSAQEKDKDVGPNDHQRSTYRMKEAPDIDLGQEKAIEESGVNTGIVAAEKHTSFQTNDENEHLDSSGNKILTKKTKAVADLDSCTPLKEGVPTTSPVEVPRSEYPTATESTTPDTDVALDHTVGSNTDFDTSSSSVSENSGIGSDQNSSDTSDFDGICRGMNDMDLDQESNTIPLVDPVKEALIERVMEEFWVIFNQRWPANVSQHTTGSSSEASGSSAPPYATTSITLLPLNQRKKRKVDDEEADGNDERDQRHPDADERKERRSETSPRFACPFRKHNSTEYSISSHRACALSSWDTIARVKYKLAYVPTLLKELLTTSGNIYTAAIRWHLIAKDVGKRSRTKLYWINTSWLYQHAHSKPEIPLMV
jgi:hypothetical protein